MTAALRHRVADWFRGQIQDVCEHHWIEIPDEGPILAYCTPTLTPTDDGPPRSELHMRLLEMAREASVEVVARFADGYQLTHTKTQRPITVLLVENVRFTAMRSTL